jgi:hypothetical protein
MQRRGWSTLWTRAPQYQGTAACVAGVVWRGGPAWHPAVERLADRGRNPDVGRALVADMVLRKVCAPSGTEGSMITVEDNGRGSGQRRALSRRFR